ncbi:class A beta-lactamase [Pseudorhizobium endolithicum]|uniref:beta-lactamase n=1 Tax=Pseudorhizobium endolithicum TaxID=1191678 RepID=A0ABM8PMB4_9HYPH|nr:class A beta-lactamase [Pseudorhizobium endolithicum]CAD7037550.1 class A beta-lactamase [Pseudorhizobium endolithicum]
MRFLSLVPIAMLTLTVGVVSPAAADTVAETAAEVEADLGGRVGVLLQQYGEAPAATYRADERFPLASTFKALACGAALSRVDAGEQDLEAIIKYGADDIVTYSPITEKHVGVGMTLGDLCHATITLSDNTAGNLVLDSVGGPSGFTAFMRKIGDEVTRLDRWEPELNEALPDDPRDTTTPRAVVTTLERLLLGDVLLPASRRQLEEWMIADQVADKLIRASLPKGWTIGDKTGAGERGSRSIIAIIRPPQGKPWLAGIYLTGSDADMDKRNEAVAMVGAAIVRAIENAVENGTD